MKTNFKNLLARLGYQVTRVPKELPSANVHQSTNFNVEEYDFDLVSPSIKYAPWLQDTEFKSIFNRIAEHTLVDQYRCYELWEIVELTQRLDKSASFLEVGVWRGGTAAVIAKKLNVLNADVPFYIADTFQGVVKATEKDFSYQGGEHADTTLEAVEDLLSNTYKNIKILAGIFPDETGKFINENEKFGFCHIDVDVYQSAKDIVEWIWEKLIVGGVIVFDDYGFETCTGILKYVNEQKSSTDRLVFYNLNGHAIMVKIR